MRPSDRLAFPKVIRHAWAVVGLWMCLLCGACSNQLTRSKAIDLIQNSPELSKPVVYSIKEGTVRDGFDPARPKRSPSKAWKQLAANGYLDLKDLGVDGMMGGPPYLNKYEIRLTTLGRSAFQAGTDGTWRIEIAKRTVQEITGIAEESENSARVEYTWAFEPASPVAQLVSPAFGLSDAGFSEPQKSSAIMRKYDDGWRLER